MILPAPHCVISSKQRIINLTGYILEGVRAGLLLSLLAGPLLVLLLQLSLRRGTLAALAGALGIWCSDAAFIWAIHLGMGGLSKVMNHTYFNEIVGSIGGLILVGSALFMWFRSPPDLSGDRIMPTKRGVLSAFAQGLAINTFNPFTVGFWSFFSITQVHDRQLSEPQAWAIYAGVLGTIILTDTIKIVAARKLRDILRPEVLLKVQRTGALALGCFGLILGVRVWMV
ncbi:LysE family transporter [Neolewinella lacunae]|uniref:LysE family transporter n=1 Tax=Neolewinella lacunae TaxID=1517758 RepID=A0A923PIN4_9BACT|nr:LysE family transporter [Neolewinella lacunae]MBC6994787.1 LysE family transporter [Neolewinella lacunae]MDN3634409.1 LysE family transporter [Neolewinella lacunae]